MLAGLLDGNKLYLKDLREGAPDDLFVVNAVQLTLDSLLLCPVYHQSFIEAARSGTELLPLRSLFLYPLHLDAERGIDIFV